MSDVELVRILTSIVLQASPLVIAVCGEILTERSGIVNLSLDGTMLMGAMTGFVVGLTFGNVWIGFLAAGLIGLFFAAILAFGTIRLRQSQFAIGFVLTLLGDDLSAFLGQNYTRTPGPLVTKLGIPLLKDIPILGPIFFDQNVVVYFSMLLVFISWWFLFRTQAGLHLRSAGERPAAAFARGVNVNRVRYLYTMIGGALVGIAGAAYSLNVKLGWSDGHIRGYGWIALAIVIFGGWSPFRGALGAILFGATKAMATTLQRTFPQVSVVAFNSIPWLLMIAVLLIVSSNISERLIAVFPKRMHNTLRSIIRVAPPMSLGSSFTEE